MIVHRPDAIRDPAVILPAGRLVNDQASALKAEVREAYAAGRDVIVDFRDVSFVDSCGLGALVVAYRMAAEEERQLLLCSVPEHVLALLRLTRLHRIFEIQPDVETARILLGAV